MNRVQVNAVLNAINTFGSSTLRKQILNAFDLAVLNLRENTGEIMLTRHQIAQEIDCSPNNAGRIMNILVTIGVFSCERIKTKGIKGSGTNIYFVNPHIAWKGSFIAFKAKIADSKPPIFLLL